MFFSVKEPLKFLGKEYKPCVCYEATKEMIPTVEKLVSDGKAYSYEKRVFFQNGKVIPSASERKAIKKAKEAEERKAKKEASKKEETEESDF